MLLEYMFYNQKVNHIPNSDYLLGFRVGLSYWALQIKKQISYWATEFEDLFFFKTFLIIIVYNIVGLC